MKIGKFIVAFAVVISCLLQGIPADAKVYVPDLTKNCSVTVTVQTVDGEKVPGGKVALYKVGTAKQGESPNTGDYYFEYTGEFSGVEAGELRKKTGEDFANETYIKKLTSHVVENNLPQSAGGEINDRGEVTVGNLKAGLYLVVQSETNPSFQAFSPFFVTLPYNDKEKEEYVYDVGIAPKIETVRKVGRLQPVTISPQVRKIVKGENAPGEKEFTVTWKRVEQSSPMPGNMETMSVKIRAGETRELDPITYTKAGIYVYQAYEEAADRADGFAYDKTVYWYEVEIASDGMKLYVKNLLIKEGSPEGKIVYQGKSAKEGIMTFTNIYNNPQIPEKPPLKKLPQTGQLWWPVWIMATAGGLLVLFGAIRKGVDKTKDR